MLFKTADPEEFQWVIEVCFNSIIFNVMTLFLNQWAELTFCEQYWYVCSGSLDQWPSDKWQSTLQSRS